MHTQGLEYRAQELSRLERNETLQSLSGLRVAITHDWLVSSGGAERVLAGLKALWPRAPIYTSLYAPAALAPEWRGWEVRTSFLQRIPFATRYHRHLLPLMPLAFESFDLSDFDLVISSASAFSKAIVTRAETLHVCYCLTPTRYLWDLYHDYFPASPGMLLKGPLLHYCRLCDRLAADRVDRFLAISTVVAKRISKHYHRESVVIHPPVDVERLFRLEPTFEDFYLFVSRLVPYKRADLAVAAASNLGCALKVVGDGPERARLRELAKNSDVEFLGTVSDAELVDLYRRCRAVVFPAYEDFGIVPVEAMAAGKPVIAYGKGGAAETVIPGKTGIIFSQQTVEAVIDALNEFERMSWSVNACREQAAAFAESRFLDRLSTFLRGALEHTL